MARARALLVLFAAARATSLHAADYGPPADAASFVFTPPPAASYRGFSSSAAASTAPSTVSRSVSSVHAADFGAPPAASWLFTPPAAASKRFSSFAAASTVSKSVSSHVAAQGAPAAVSRGLLGSALAPVAVGGSGGGGGRPFRRLGYGALAAFAGFALLLTVPGITLLDDEEEGRSTEEERTDDLPMLDHDDWKDEELDDLIFDIIPRRAPTGQEVRVMTMMLRRVDRRMKNLVEMEKKAGDNFWHFLEDLIKKAKILQSALSLIKEYYTLISSTVLGSILFYEKYGDPSQYFVCPYSGYSEVVGVFLFSVKPKDETHQADGSSGGSPALQAKFCSDNKRLIHFSMCEVYGGSFLPKDNTLRKEPEFLGQPEHESPCNFAPIVKQRCYACAKQFIERLNFVEGAENDLEFSWIGPRMDFIRGFDGPSKGVPRVLACFNSENPARANGRIFNVRNPNSEEVAVRELAEMTEVYAAVSAQQFYGEGYDDSDERIPGMTLSNKQLGWNLMPTLKHLLEKMLTQKDAVKTQMSQASASS